MILLLDLKKVKYHYVEISECYDINMTRLGSTWEVDVRVKMGMKFAEQLEGNLKFVSYYDTDHGHHGLVSTESGCM